MARKSGLDRTGDSMMQVLMTAVVVAGALGASAISGELEATAAQSCESLALLPLPHATITLAQTVGPGPCTAPTRAGGGAAPLAAAQAFRDLPAFCRVAATLKPSSDSDIRVEVWLPASGWNGKYQGVGGGGFAGVISYPAMSAAVTAGYATASTDTGHTGGTADFALGHPEKLIDFGYRAIHETTLFAKSLVDAFYGSGPKLSFFNGCSTGGRQAITEAQRYPADFDAIVARPSAWDSMRLHAVRVAVSQAINRDSGGAIPPRKFPMIHHAVLDACDALDGVRDGVIENPLQCHFDYAKLACTEIGRAHV